MLYVGGIPPATAPSGGGLEPTFHHREILDLQLFLGVLLLIAQHRVRHDIIRHENTHTERDRPGPKTRPDQTRPDQTRPNLYYRE